MSYGKSLEHRRERVQGREQISEEVTLFRHGLILDMREEEARAKDEAEYRMYILDCEPLHDLDFDEPFDLGSDFDDDRYDFGSDFDEHWDREPLFADDDPSFFIPLDRSYEEPAHSQFIAAHLAEDQKSAWLAGGDPAKCEAPRQRRFAGKDVIW